MYVCIYIYTYMYIYIIDMIYVRRTRRTGGETSRLSRRQRLSKRARDPIWERQEAANAADRLSRFMDIATPLWSASDCEHDPIVVGR